MALLQYIVSAAERPILPLTAIVGMEGNYHLFLNVIVWDMCRSVGVRLGKGEALADILASSSQVAEGVATAGVVVSLARTYRVSLPVLTAVAQVGQSVNYTFSSHLGLITCLTLVVRVSTRTHIQTFQEILRHSQISLPNELYQG